jgi:hypothetical protein
VTDSSSKYSEVVKSLLETAIDYIGCIPAEQVTLFHAIRKYLLYRKEEHAWLLGKFLLPVSQLQEFENAAGRLLPGESAPPIHLSVTVGDDLLAELRRVAEFNNGFFAAGNNIVIDSMEFSVATASEILKIHDLLPSHLQAYFEIPLNDHSEELIEAAALIGGRAKLQIDAILPGNQSHDEDILHFFDSCHRLNVPFTIRTGFHFLTNVSGMPSDASKTLPQQRYSFLGLFLAAGFIRSSMSIAEASSILGEGQSRACSFDEQGISWRGFRLDLEQIKNVRENLFVSFGIPSFTGLIDELKSSGLL